MLEPERKMQMLNWWYECIHANGMLSSMRSLTNLVCPSRLSTSDSHKCMGHQFGQKVRLPSRPWPELRYNGWHVSGLDPAKAWAVLSSSTDMTLDKGGQTDQLVLCQSSWTRDRDYPSQTNR